MYTFARRLTGREYRAQREKPAAPVSRPRGGSTYENFSTDGELL